jgi:hypothetical protein
MKKNDQCRARTGDLVRLQCLLSQISMCLEGKSTPGEGMEQLTKDT